MKAVVRRLLADKRARLLIQKFGEEWLGIRNIDNLDKSPTALPKWKPNYDAMGVWRDQENGKAIDASGELVGTDVDGAVAQAVALGTQLARSPQARACIVKQWFRYSFGREEAQADACTIAQLAAGFEKNGFDLASLIVDTMQTQNLVARQNGVTP